MILRSLSRQLAREGSGEESRVRHAPKSAVAEGREGGREGGNSTDAAGGDRPSSKIPVGLLAVARGAGCATATAGVALSSLLSCSCFRELFF